jgi:hypothetical protein
MKKVEVTKEFVLEAHKNACNNWKQRIEKELPELFKSKWEIGKWYHTEIGNLICLTEDTPCFGGNYYGYGFINGVWDSRFNGAISKEATKEEVEAALIAEADKLGFKEGAKFEHNIEQHKELKGEYYRCGELSYEDGVLFCDGWTIMDGGKWATIIEEPEELTIEQIQKELGRKIKIVE